MSSENSNGQRSKAKQPGSQEAEGGKKAGVHDPFFVPHAREGAGKPGAALMLPDSGSPAAAVAPTSTRFEIRDRTRRISCTISDEALEAVSNLRVPSTGMLRQQSFARFRTLIDAAAKLKLSTMPDGFVGSLTILQDDLRHVPDQKGMPQFGSMSWAMRRVS